MNINNMRREINKSLHIHGSDLPPYTGWNKSTTRETIYDLFKIFGYKIGAEIGVKRGENAIQIFKRVPSVKLYLIDPWNKYSRSMTEQRAESYYQTALKQLKPYNTVFMRKTSMQAVKEFKDGSLDFIYIDGMHDFDNVICDLVHWAPKVRKGGIVSGHDYLSNAVCGVARAVDAYVQAHGITHLYATRHGIPSFFWVQQRRKFTMVKHD
jgi:predicted O-methyltransferase YrrM